MPKLPRLPWGMALCFICCLLLLQAYAIASADIDDRPILVLRVDDSLNSWAVPFNGFGGKSGLEYGKMLHIPITWGIISKFASNPSQYQALSWAQLQDYLDTCGGEAASHSVNHTPMNNQYEYVDDVINSKTAIESNLHGYTCTTFLQPGTWTGDAYMDTFSKLDNPIGRAIQATYAQSQAYLGNGWNIGNVSYTYGLTNTTSLDTNYFSSISAMQAAMDIVAATPGLIYVVSMHGLMETGQSAAYKTPADLTKAFFDKIADLRSKGRIRLMGLSDAYHAVLSKNLNHIVDPGFELTDLSPSAAKCAWNGRGLTQITQTDGINGSRCAYLPDSTCGMNSNLINLAPGRYQVSWSQKLRGTRDAGLFIWMANIRSPNGSANRAAIDWAYYYSGSGDAWVRKTAFVTIPDRLNLAQIGFIPASDGGYLLDDVSIVSAPLDPAISPTNTVVTPDIGRCMITWHTPPDPNVRTIVIRYGSSTHPTTPTEGKALATIGAMPNANQMAIIPVDWVHSRQYFFFSVFAVKADGSYSPPDLAYVRVDTTPPPAPTVEIGPAAARALSGRWYYQDTSIQAAGYRYAIGSKPGLDDISPWTPTTQNNVSLQTVRPGIWYLSVQAESPFEAWSNSGYAQAIIASDGKISSALNYPDGTALSVSGSVTAVFADCCYIEDSNRLRAIKLVGQWNCSPGDVISTSGRLTTLNGERAIAPN